MEIETFKYILEQRGYGFEGSTKEHPAVAHILLRTGEIVGKLSIFVLRDELIEKDVKRFLDNISIRRALEAERKEEIDVCGNCYRHYLPMRKLQEIYPDWPPVLVPQCDYCERQAKYHVHRSDWITFSRQGEDHE